MIRIDKLSRYYGDLKAIDEISFHIGKGEIVGFLGPNAAGKTTTMRILTGYMPASSGTAQIAGFDVFYEPMKVKRRIGYLPENPPLYPEMRVDAYLNFVATIKGVENEKRSKSIEKVIERTAISEVRHTLIGKLSKGYRQRVGLAQALIHEPEVLILDEPTVGLDPKQISEVRDLIKSLAGEHTIILSSHILPEVSMTCERIIIINKGKIVAEDTPDHLMSKVSRSEKIMLEVRGPRQQMFDKLNQIKGVARVLDKNGKDSKVTKLSVEFDSDVDLRHEIARTVVNSGWDLLEMKRIKASLEEVFLHLTTEEKGVKQRA